MTPKIVITGGGTGGHLFPGLALADELKRRWPKAQIEFIGARRGLESRLVPQAGYPLWLLPLSGMKGTGPIAGVVSGLQAGWALVRCAARMLRRRPDLVIGVGGYASGPATLAAVLVGRKTMVMEQNHYPGATNRFLAKRVGLVCVPSESARRRLGGIGVVTGNPVRAAFHAIGEPPLAETLSLLVFGGSRGARSINRAMVAALPMLAGGDDPPRIVHQTGSNDHDLVKAAYRARYPDDRHEVHRFLDDMPTRLAAADLVVCRAGATTLAELAAAGRGAILVPYPHAADDHQRLNALAVAEAAAARVILDGDLDGTALVEEIRRLNTDRPSLAAMARAARGLAHPDATDKIADLACALIEGREVADVS